MCEAIIVRFNSLQYFLHRVLSFFLWNFPTLAAQWCISFPVIWAFLPVIRPVRVMQYAIDCPPSQVWRDSFTPHYPALCISDTVRFPRMNIYSRVFLPDLYRHQVLKIIKRQIKKVLAGHAIKFAIKESLNKCVLVNFALINFVRPDPSLTSM